MATPSPQTHMSQSHLHALLSAQKNAYDSQGIPSLEHRLASLNDLFNILKTNQHAIAEAISKDFGHRAQQETQLAELFLCIDGIRYIRKHLKKWMRPQKRSTSIWLLGSGNRVIPQPLVWWVLSCHGTTRYFYALAPSLAPLLQVTAA